MRFSEVKNELIVADLNKLEIKVVYMIHQLKRHLITLRFEYPTYAYDVNSDVNGMERKHVHQTAQFGKLEIIASCMIFQIDPIRQFCTKHVPMTQYAIIISTSTTPS